MKITGAHKIYVGVLMVVFLINAALFCVPASLSAPVLSQWKENLHGAVAWIKPASAEETSQDVMTAVHVREVEPVPLLSVVTNRVLYRWTKVTEATGSLWHAAQEIPVAIGQRIMDVTGSTKDRVNRVFTSMGDAVDRAFASVRDIGNGIATFTGNTVDGISHHMVTRSKLLWGMGKSSIQSISDMVGNSLSAVTTMWHSMTDRSSSFHTASISVAEIEPAAGGDIDLLTIDKLSDNEPVVSTKKEVKRKKYRFPIEERRLDTDAVLVPGQKAVISSSRDGKIKDIYVHNGDLFKKGDILLEYVCADVKGEAKLNKAQEKIASTRSQGSFRLLKLGLISDLEKLEMDAEQMQVEAQADVLEARMDDCRITAPFDGRVTNRLANPNEYTRTDRVLIEIAEVQAMNAEFVVPSRWLRWINVGAPLVVYLDDMGQKYEGEIIRIHGEVDPVSETVQVVGKINMLEDNLFPGMSGTVTLDAREIRDQDIRGILEEKIILSDKS